MLRIYPQGRKSLVRSLAQLELRDYSLADLLKYGERPTQSDIIENAQDLHREVPRRLAHRAEELSKLPIIGRSAQVRRLQVLISKSAELLAGAPKPTTPTSEAAFCRLHDTVRLYHAGLHQLMAQAMGAPPSLHNVDAEPPELTEALDEFYHSRIVNRLLVDHHMSLHDGGRPGFSGAVQSDCSPAAVVRDAADSARILCDENFGFAPLVNVVDAEEPLRIQCIPTHLRACVWELLKNALRATAEAAKREEHRKKQGGFGKGGAGAMMTAEQAEEWEKERDVRFAVNVHVTPRAGGTEGAEILVCDSGGGLVDGVSGRSLEQPFSYLYSTASHDLYDPVLGRQQEGERVARKLQGGMGWASAIHRAGGGGGGGGGGNSGGGGGGRARARDLPASGRGSDAGMTLLGSRSRPATVLPTMPPGWVWTRSGLYREEDTTGVENCATFGVGLPIARLYARFSGGDVELRNFAQDEDAAATTGEAGLEARVTWGEIGTSPSATL